MPIAGIIISDVLLAISLACVLVTPLLRRLRGVQLSPLAVAYRSALGIVPLQALLAAYLALTFGFGLAIQLSASTGGLPPAACLAQGFIQVPLTLVLFAALLDASLAAFRLATDHPLPVPRTLQHPAARAVLLLVYAAVPTAVIAAAVFSPIDSPVIPGGTGPALTCGLTPGAWGVLVATLATALLPVALAAMALSSYAAYKLAKRGAARDVPVGLFEPSPPPTKADGVRIAPRNDDRARLEPLWSPASYVAVQAFQAVVVALTLVINLATWDFVVLRTPYSGLAVVVATSGLPALLLAQP
ncbi:hypothetical protein H9P43_005492 [Blastocladiella emersonii ATCC 22665]|nr:hypothetical protein H9P43_005492 [Blastocladiella emersonii ATCC 22665]